MAKKGSKLSEETKKKMSEANKGHIPWNKGRKGLQKNYNLSGLKKGWGWNKGNKGYKAREQHYNWKGGISKLAKLLWQTSEYQEWRLKVFTRDNYTCCNCHKVGGYLEAHHIKELYLILKEKNIKTMEQARNCKELWDINNGATLCRECHKLTFKGRPKLWQ